MKLPAPGRAGEYEFEVYVVSQSYVGLDQQIPFTMKVISAGSLPSLEPVKDDDADLDNESGLFEGMGSTNVDSDVSGDEGTPEAASGAAVTLSDAQQRQKQKRTSETTAEVEAATQSTSQQKQKSSEAAATPQSTSQQRQKSNKRSSKKKGRAKKASNGEDSKSGSTSDENADP